MKNMQEKNMSENSSRQTVMEGIGKGSWSSVDLQGLMKRRKITNKKKNLKLMELNITGLFAVQSFSDTSVTYVTEMKETNIEVRLVK